LTALLSLKIVTVGVTWTVTGGGSLAFFLPTASGLMTSLLPAASTSATVPSRDRPMNASALTPGGLRAAAGSMLLVLALGGGVRAAEDHSVQHARPVDVVAVLGAPGGLLGGVDALDLGAEEPSLLGPTLFGHGSAPLLAELGDGVPHLLVGAAAADVAAEPFF